ncbi:hypothetical protein [Pseudomonas chlororaphis]|uniref:hypothetical protein n=1 Tax=Pseudomonas chlororaphis TaxID=587753 RepID=UPI0023657E65|nr:hypothetical protein [Pseudomonas chlororaphis]WDG52474.1 hypothetical protein PUP76_21745 [Pseudomonas chlororaphis]WDH86509.1 hypothetical protein PUP74_20440 [Pseudomonas chlororaphis]
MTDYTELKRLVEAGSLPPIVSTLIAENERLRADLDGEMSRARDFNLEHEELKHERDQLKAGFKNFHRSLCERFGYYHDDIDWQRDQVSLEEHIAAQFSHVSAENSSLRSQMETVQRGAGQLKAENEELRKDAERYRWFRNSGDPDIAYLDSRGHIYPEALDEEIDAAMGKGGQP